jgi:hypothetical protein
MLSWRATTEIGNPTSTPRHLLAGRVPLGCIDERLHRASARSTTPGEPVRSGLLLRSPSPRVGARLQHARFIIN